MVGMAGRSFKLSYEIPNMELTLENERQVITAMTKAVEKLIRDRTNRGLDSSLKPFPKPKDGGTALEETGQLKAAIGHKIRHKKARTSKTTGRKSPERYVGVVRALGNRDMTRTEAKTRRGRAKAKTAAMRAEAKADFGRGIVRKDLGARVSTKTGKLSIGRTKVHAITTNAALAAVLSVDPKDPTGIAGNRKKYRIYEASPREIDAATKTLSKGGRFKLRALAGRRKKVRR